MFYHNWIDCNLTSDNQMFLFFLIKMCIFMGDSKEDVVMSKAIKIIKLFFIFSFIAIFTACAPAKKNPFYQKKKKSSQVSSTQIGRNKYYFSSGYQKKLNSSYKKK